MQFWQSFFNLNSISAHNYNKAFILEDYIAIHKSDIIVYQKYNLIPILLMMTIWTFLGAS